MSCEHGRTCASAVWVVVVIATVFSCVDSTPIPFASVVFCLCFFRLSTFHSFLIFFLLVSVLPLPLKFRPFLSSWWRWGSVAAPGSRPVAPTHEIHASLSSGALARPLSPLARGGPLCLLCFASRARFAEFTRAKGICVVMIHIRMFLSLFPCSLFSLSFLALFSHSLFLLSCSLAHLLTRSLALFLYFPLFLFVCLFVCSGAGRYPQSGSYRGRQCRFVVSSFVPFANPYVSRDPGVGCQ
jgi:hypothetical protein